MSSRISYDLGKKHIATELFIFRSWYFGNSSDEHVVLEDATVHLDIEGACLKGKSDALHLEGFVTGFFEGMRDARVNKGNKLSKLSTLGGAYAHVRPCVAKLDLVSETRCFASHHMAGYVIGMGYRGPALAPLRLS